MSALGDLAAWSFAAAPSQGFNVLREAFKDPSVIIQKEGWIQIMNGVRITLTLGAALLLSYAARARRLGRPVAARTERRVALVMTLLAFSAYFDFYNPNARYS